MVDAGLTRLAGLEISASEMTLLASVYFFKAVVLMFSSVTDTIWSLSFKCKAVAFCASTFFCSCAVISILHFVVQKVTLGVFTFVVFWDVILKWYKNIFITFYLCAVHSICSTHLQHSLEQQGPSLMFCALSRRHGQHFSFFHFRDRKSKECKCS